MERKKRIYRVYFDCGEEFIIIPMELVRLLLSANRKTDRVTIAYADIFPDGYGAYLIRVLNSNRHLPPFAYRYVSENPICERGMIRILIKQLQNLKVNEAYCFAEIKDIQFGEKTDGVILKYSPEFLAMKQESNRIFYYEPLCTF